MGAQAAFPACASTPLLHSPHPSFPECPHPTLRVTYTHPQFPELGNTEQTFSLITLSRWMSLHCGNPKTYGCSSGDSAPRRWLHCCRCWPTRLQSPGSREPGILLSHRASACGRHGAPVIPPPVPVFLPHLLSSSLEGTFSSLEKGFSICFSYEETGALEMEPLR